MAARCSRLAARWERCEEGAPRLLERSKPLGFGPFLGGTLNLSEQPEQNTWSCELLAADVAITTTKLCA